MAILIRHSVTDSQRWKIRMLAQAGFHGKFIAACVSTPSHQISVSVVYRVCKEAEIRLRDYRNGIGVVARAAVYDVNQEMKGATKRASA